MRLEKGGILKDHPKLQDQEPESHHPPGEDYRIIVNGQFISPFSAYELRQTLTYDGHKTITANLRGANVLTISKPGNDGVYAIGTDAVQESESFSIAPYGGSGPYYTSYMGGYSRLHGDSYLTPNMFSGAVRLRDIYIDGNEAVLEFYNASASSAIMQVYGAVHCK